MVARIASNMTVSYKAASHNSNNEARKGGGIVARRESRYNDIGVKEIHLD